MIKKFEQFTKLNERQMFNTREHTYLEIHVDLCQECAMSHIDSLIQKGGKIKLDRPMDMVFFREYDNDYSNVITKKIVAFELGTQEDLDIFSDICLEHMLYITDNDEFVVAIAEDGDRIPVDYWTCSSDFLFEIDSEFDK
jgi:hypothetical protein